MIIVDGYNVMYASETLQALAGEDLDAAREKLVEALLEYCAVEGMDMEVVFDAASRAGPANSESLSDNLKVTFTAEGQTADSYIEKLAYRFRGSSLGEFRIVTGDYDQQKVAGGAGMLRMSSREFLEELRESRERSESRCERSGEFGQRSSLEERLPDDLKSRLARMRERLT